MYFVPINIYFSYCLNVIFLLLFFPLFALKNSYEINFDHRVAGKSNNLRQIQSHRSSLEFTQSSEGNWFAARVGARARSESAYAKRADEFSDSFVSKNSSEIEFRDAYIQLQQGSWRLRAGNHQVVWGEAFGFFYADIINPKDLREVGLGSLGDNRIPSPILNLQYLGSKWSLQLLANFRPQGSLLPDAESPFAPASLRSLSLPVSDGNTNYDNPEAGANFGFTSGSLDVHLFAHEGIQKISRRRGRSYRQRKAFCYNDAYH